MVARKFLEGESANMDNSIDHYQAVLRDLELRRSRCQAELAEIDSIVIGIKKLLAKQASLFVSAPAPKPEATIELTVGSSTAPLARFANMSVRWAILKLLAENTGAHMTAAEIAQALVDGGMNSKGKNFASNVSAVLSDMKNKRTEVGNAAGAWALTATGIEAWGAIKATPQYRNRLSSQQTTLQ
jgi:hypothetical protein